MNKNNKKKNDQLGQPFGTACNKLRKQIMFSLLALQGLNKCFKCSRDILDIAELSIEHKEPWLDSEDPKTKFFDLNNIAFSHLKCNISSSRKPNKYSVEADRLNAIRTSTRESMRRSYTSEKRREKYLRTGN